MAGSRNVTYDDADWQQLDFRQAKLREARKIARRSYCLVIIKVKTAYGVLVRATVDGRFWLMNAAEFVEEKPQRAPSPGASARRALTKQLKAPSFLF